MAGIIVDALLLCCSSPFWAMPVSTATPSLTLLEMLFLEEVDTGYSGAVSTHHIVSSISKQLEIKGLVATKTRFGSVQCVPTKSSM